MLFSLTFGLFFLFPSDKFCLCNGYCGWYLVDFGFCYCSLIECFFVLFCFVFCPGRQLTRLDSNASMICSIATEVSTHTLTPFSCCFLLITLKFSPNEGHPNIWAYFFTGVLWPHFWDSSFILQWLWKPQTLSSDSSADKRQISASVLSDYSCVGR